MLPWVSTWYATKTDFADLLEEDEKIRSYVKKRFRNGIAKIRIERTREKVIASISFGLRQGMIIGKKGRDREADQGAGEADEAAHRSEDLRDPRNLRWQIRSSGGRDDVAAEQLQEASELPPGR